MSYVYNVTVTSVTGTEVWNETTEEVLNATSLPKKDHYSIYEVVLIALVAGFLSIVTVLGNLMVMISFKMDKQLQTISNYFLLSLAIADFAIGLISMPLFTVYTVLGSWELGPLVCDTWLALDYLMSNASVLNLLIISFDRYFSVTRPLTYRARRTTRRAIFMIASAWIISLILWPPWIYLWPYIEGARYVPEDECYIQFLETNSFITFGTAIAAFYCPVTVMCILYWRIWRETEKRQKDLTNLQAGRKENSKRSTSSDEVVQEPEIEWKQRSRGDSNVQGEDLETTYVPTAMCVENPRYLKVPGRTKPRRWLDVINACLRNCRIDRDTEFAEEDSTSDAGHGSPGTTTPASAETPVQSSVSQTLSVRQDLFPPPPTRSISTIRDLTQPSSRTDPMIPLIERSSSSTETKPGVRQQQQQQPQQQQQQTRSVSSDSVYTILIRFPTETSLDGGAQPSIKMITEEEEGLEAETQLARTRDEGTNIRRSESHLSDLNVGRDFSLHPGGGCTSPLRRLSKPPQNIKLPLNTKLVPKQVAKGGGVKKKKKKSQERKQDRKAAKTLSAILLAFIITWTPYNVLVLIRTLIACDNDDCISKELWDFSYYLCYINSTINPLCYALCNASFRRTYIRILRCKWHTKRRHGMRGFYN